MRMLKLSLACLPAAPSRTRRRQDPYSLFRLRPVFKSQPRHAREFAPVRSDENGVAPTRLCGDEHIVGADRRSRAFQCGADISRLVGIRLLEGQDLDRPRQKVDDAPRVALGTSALCCAVAELEQDD